MDSPYTTRKLDAAAGWAARQRVEVPLFGPARHLYIEPTLFTRRRRLPSRAWREHLSGLTPVGSALNKHSWHRPMCHVLTGTT